MSIGNFRADIQGLRAIAVLSVIAFHFNPSWLPGGFVGVDIFFVISGYLITSILLKKREQENYQLFSTLRYFYSSRIKRILPAYFSMLVIVALIAAILFLPQDFKIFKQGLEKSAWFTSNIYFASFGDYFAPANHEQPLLHTWSLAVEVQFYLLAPMLVLLLPRKFLVLTSVSLAVVFTLIAQYRLSILQIEQSTYYGLYARLPEFLAGGLAAIYGVSSLSIKRSNWLGMMGLALVAISVFMQPIMGTFPGVAALVPVFGVVLILLHPAIGWQEKLLSNKALVWVGALSYSLYLWHWPILAFLRYYTGAEVLSIGYSTVFIVLTLGFSVVSYYVVERQFQASQVVRKQIVGGALLISVIATSQVMAKVNEIFTPEQLPIEYRRYADPATICHGKIVGDCLKGDLNSDKEVLVLGDSHAAMLNHFFDHLGNEIGFKARIITASSCLTVDDFDIEYIAEWARKDCFEQIIVAKNYVNNADFILLAGMWNYQLVSDKNIKAISQFLEQHKEKNIAVLPQIPELLIAPQRHIRFEKLGLSRMQGVTHDWFWYDLLIKQIVSDCINCRLLPNEVFKESGVLPYDKQKLLYYDESHLNEYGSIHYSEVMRPHIVSWLGQSND